MLREHAQIWAMLDLLEGGLGTGTVAESALCKPLTVQLLHHDLKILYPRADDALPPVAGEPAAGIPRLRRAARGVGVLKARPVTRNAGR